MKYYTYVIFIKELLNLYHSIKCIYEIILLKKKISMKFLNREILCYISFLDYFMFHFRSRQKYFKKSDTTLLKSVISRLDGIFHMFQTDFCGFIQGQTFRYSGYKKNENGRFFLFYHLDDCSNISYHQSPFVII